MEEINALKSENKKLVIKAVISAAVYALGITFFCMDMDIGMKVIFGLLFCGLPFVVGYNSRKMDKLAKKAQAKGAAVVVVKQKKKGLLRRILTSILGLAAGIIATPYLIVKYIMTIVANSKRVKELQSGGAQPVVGAAGYTGVDSGAGEVAAADMSGGAAGYTGVDSGAGEVAAADMSGGAAQPMMPQDGTSQQALMMQQLQMQQQQMQAEKEKVKRRKKIGLVVVLIYVVILVLGLVLGPQIPEWIQEAEDRKEAEAYATVFESSAMASKVQIGMVSGDLDQLFKVYDEDGNEYGTVQAAEYSSIDYFGDEVFSSQIDYAIEKAYYYPQEHVDRIERIQNIVGENWRANIDGFFTTDEQTKTQIDEFVSGTHAEIAVTYIDGVIAKVAYDSAAPNLGTAAEKTPDGYSVIDAHFVQGIDEVYIEYAATFTDGSYIRAAYAKECERSAAGSAEVTWSDEFYDGYTAAVTGEGTNDFVVTRDDALLSALTQTMYIVDDMSTSNNSYGLSNSYPVTKVVIADGVSVSADAITNAYFRSVEEIVVGDGVSFSSFAKLFDDSPFYSDSDNWQDGGLYFGDTLVAADETVSDFTVRDGTRTIARRLFDSTVLTRLVLPASVESISNIWSNTGGVDAIEYVYYGTQEQWDELPKDASWYYLDLTILG